MAATLGIGAQSAGAAAKKGSKSNAKREFDGSLKKTSEKLALPEKIHRSFSAKRVGDHVVFTAEDLDKNLKVARPGDRCE